MNDMGTSRSYRPDPTGIGLPEVWGRGRARASVAPDAVTVTVAGEIDASNAANLSGYLLRHSTVATRLCVDLRDVTFFATSGLAILRRLEHQCHVSDASWGLLASPTVQKVLRICGADDLPLLDSTADALNLPEPAALAVTAR